MSNFNIVQPLSPVKTVIVTGGLVPKGPYNESTDYQIGDCVSYNGSSYIMWSDAPSGIVPTNTDYWQII